jgi:hypothetical protein
MGSGAAQASTTSCSVFGIATPTSRHVTRRDRFGCLITQPAEVL